MTTPGRPMPGRGEPATHLTCSFPKPLRFDFGDNWWHQIHVTAVEQPVPDGTFPRVTKRVGRSPPQYPDDEDAE